MNRLIVELTDRCNLSCRHCPSGRHGGRGELTLERLTEILLEGHDQGITMIAFTGGEPLLHTRFGEMVAAVAMAGYSFSMVSNGYALPRRVKDLLPYKEALLGITFSLDGATANSHDAQRGSGSFLRLMQAVSVCIAHDIPFSFNASVHKYNFNELEALVQLAQGLASSSIGFGFLVGQEMSGVDSMQLTEQQRKKIAIEIDQLQARSSISVALAPGRYTEDLSPCGALREEEANLDWQGRLGLCCHLSGTGGKPQRPSIVVPEQSSLEHEMSKLRKIRETLLTHKRQHLESDQWQDADYWPCQYCERYFFNNVQVEGEVSVTLQD